MNPFSEPWHKTLVRTGSLALAIGAGFSVYSHRLAALPRATLFALWFTLGGHFVELLYRNRLRQFLGPNPALQAGARLGYWFVGGSALAAGAFATQRLVWPWWAGGVLFIGLELVIHLFLQLRRQPSFYNGRG